MIRRSSVSMLIFWLSGDVLLPNRGWVNFHNVVRTYAHNVAYTHGNVALRVMQIMTTR